MMSLDEHKKNYFDYLFSYDKKLKLQRALHTHVEYNVNITEKV